MYEEFPRRLEQLKPPGEERRGPNCPPESVWWHLAAGLLPESRAAELLEHSTRCDACALLLRQATQDFADEITEQEITHIKALASAQEEWQQSLAQRLSATESGRGKRETVLTPVAPWLRGLADWFSWQPRSVFRYAWAYAAAAILLVVAGVWLVQTRREPSREPSVDQLIADAYTEQRPFELRIPGAAYGPVRQERGGERSAFAEPAGLLKAKYVIKERLAARPDDETMLAASGRVELLEGHYDEAIRTFGRLLDAHPDSPPLLTDLATAYFQRAESADRAVDYGQSIELFGRVLAKKPDDPVALFNRAIALERMYAYNEAIRDWEHYLRIDPSGNWGAEAQRRLSALQEKMKARDKPSAMLRSDPGEAAPILKARAAGQLASPAPWPASLDEEYLELAVREWLASLFASANSSGQQTWQRDPAVWNALTATADVLRTHHKDPWLADLLHDLPADSSPPDVTVQFVRALNLLAQAAKASADGDPDSARPLAKSAADAFRIAKSHAGYLRAREEIMYTLVRGVRVQDCIQVSGQQLRETKLDSYTWLKGQAILWHATCQNYAGNLDLAQRLSEQALELTKSTGYPGQHLRSVLFASGFLRSTERNWQDTRAGLQ
jgi:tetratricopeptide (TPR) repeat protein